jgi:N-acetylmuramoyl-L-alanine amidase
MKTTLLFQRHISLRLRFSMIAILACASLLFFAPRTMFAQHSDLSGLKFCIDQGHGGYNDNDRHIIPDAGTDFYESESNYYKGIWVKHLLEAQGAWVILTRPNKDSTYDNSDSDEPSLSARWRLANDNNVNWFHSIHSNAFDGKTNYTMVLLKENISTRQPAFPASVDMSSYIYNNIRARDRTSSSGGNVAGKAGVYLDYTFYGGTNGGYNLGVLSGLAMPGELSEGSFHDYFPETRRLMNNDYRKNEAYGILNGFLQYYGVPFDTLGVICGTQVDKSSGNKPINNIVVHLLSQGDVQPVDKIYHGDNFNNGYFFFDSLSSGNYSVVFETPGFPNDTVKVTILSTRNPVTNTEPAASAIQISRSKVITLTFGSPMDTAKIRTAFSITPSVNGVIAWSNNNTVMTFTPSQLFDYKKSYTVSLAGMGNSPAPLVFVDNTTVTSNVGATPFTFAFTTVALPPYVSTVQPAMNDTAARITLPVGIRFSETMDTASVRSAFTISPAVSGRIAWTNSNTTFLFYPDSSFPYNTDFTVTIGTTAKSTYGDFVDGNRDSVGGDAYVLTFHTMQMPTGVAQNPNEAPTKFGLEQNYPNPFNPTTHFQFSIPQLAIVTLQIYDLLGREVATLVNERKSPGTYEVQFDASSLPSGVYFYRLEAGSFVETKKLVLVR